jgi:hypothetical protein
MAFASKEATNDALAALAIGTGGLFFENRNDLDLGFRELGIRPDIRYLMAFTPPGAPDGQYHHLKVRLKSKGTNLLQSRQGYRSVKAVAAPEPAHERPIDRAAFADNTIEDLAGDLTARQIRTQSGVPGVMAVFHVDLKGLTFREESDARHQRLSLIAMLADAQGHFVAGKEGTVTLALKDQTFRDYSPAGMNFTLTLPAAAGSYRLRVVMAVGSEGKMRARTMPIDVQ